MSDIRRFRVYVEIEINAPMLDEAMEYVASGVAHASDDARVTFTGGEDTGIDGWNSTCLFCDAPLSGKWVVSCTSGACSERFYDGCA